MAISLRLGIAALIGLCLGMSSIRAEDSAAVGEILRLKDNGVAEETIVAYIRSRTTRFDLSAANIITLREQGLTPVVINAMLESGAAADPGPAVPEPAEALPMASAQASSPGGPLPPALDQDVAYFHQELSPYGRWILSEEGRWYWQPTVAVGNPEWRPYWDQGRWVYTDHGWYWASNYPWGWAAFHYGRWNLHPHHGWIWYPDREWAPAWVTWRFGGDYCGWAPLPSYSHYDPVVGGLTFHGTHVEASFGFGLEWNHFTFAYLRDMGDRPRARFRQEADARRVFRETTPLNNFTTTKGLVNAEAHPRLVNQGIDPGRVTAVRGKPMATVTIQDRRVPAADRKPERVDVRAKTLEVYRPRLVVPDRPAPVPSATLTHPSPATPAAVPRNLTPSPRGVPASAPGPAVRPPPAAPRSVQPAVPAAGRPSGEPRPKNSPPTVNKE